MRHARIFLVLLLLVGCTTNPYTGRSQLLLIDRDTEMKMGLQAYEEMIGKENVTFDPGYLGPVEQVTHRLAEMMERGWGDIPPPRYNWDVRVIDNPKVMNAWCLPGGKMAVYTGIFPVMHDQNGLAVVMGHELMHAVLRHGVERISEGLAMEIGKTILTETLGGDDPKKKAELYAVLGITTALAVALPHSRGHETEADEFGLYLAAKAGYDPRAGPEVWRRMEQMGGGGGPEFLSTHPSHDTRIENMQRWMPKAMEYYEASQKQNTCVLPGAQGARRYAPPPELAAGAGVMPQGTRRGTIDGNPGARFDFALRHPAYIRDIVVDFPDGNALTIEANSPSEAQVVRGINVWRMSPDSPPLPSGTYRMTFRGKVGGAEFSEAAAWELE